MSKRGARVVSAAGEGTENDDPSSELFRRMIDAFSSYERALIAARTRSALRAKRARGERTGFLPYGFQVAADGRTLQPMAAEQNTLCLIRARREAGDSLTKIAARLNRLGARTRAGSAWRFEYVRSLLARAA